MSHRRLLPLATLAALLVPASADAAVTVGTLAGEPTVSCVDGGAPSYNDCTVTDVSAGYAAPVSGVITRWSLRHGAQPSVTIPAAGLRILTAAGPQTFTARLGGVSSLSGAATTDTFTFTFTDDHNRPNGVPVVAGERIAVYVNDAALPIMAAGSGGGWTLSSHSSGSRIYMPVAGTLLLQATIEPDADGDGYGDETQDACTTVAGPAACPGTGGNDSTGGNGGGDIKPFLSDNIQAFHAETPSVYRAATIKRLPSRVNLFDAVKSGWSEPIRCSLACRITTAATLRNISGTLVAMMSRTVDVGVTRGSFPSAGTGKLRVMLSRKARRALRRYRHTVKVTLRTTVRDGRRTASRTQTVTLAVKRR